MNFEEGKVIATLNYMDSILELTLFRYLNDRVAVMLLEVTVDEDDGETYIDDWGDVSVNVPMVDLNEGHFVLSQGMSELPDLLEKLEATGKIRNTKLTASYGFCCDRPIYEVIE